MKFFALCSEKYSFFYNKISPNYSLVEETQFFAQENMVLL